jgi:hypothetical protein
VALAALLAVLVLTPAADAKKRVKPRPAAPVAVKPNGGTFASPFGPPKKRGAKLRAVGDSYWIDGNWSYQYGTNCANAILGSSYTEPMVVSYTRYGGLDHIPKVGEQYYGSVVSAVTGNPCPWGYSYVAHEVLLPKGTSIVPGSIQCIGTLRNGSVQDITNQTWQDPTDSSRTGRYCPTGTSQGTHGGQWLGFRPLASGQIFEIRFKLVSTQELKGAAASPADELGAYIQSTGTYGDTTAKTWINVLAPAAPAAPVTIYTPNPAYETLAPPAGTNGQVKLRGLTYTGKRTGVAFFRIYDANGGLIVDGGNPASCPANVCQSPLNNTSDLWLSEQLWNIPASPTARYKYRLVFRESGTNAETQGPLTDFRPYFADADKDGVDDATDQCDDKAAPGTANGCPATAPPPDADADGVPDSKDACPNDKPAISTADGCTPDTDGDGKRDNVDKCPTVPAATADGCPAPPPDNGGNNNGGNNNNQPPAADGDGDGVLDAADRCPGQAGPASNGGCPVQQPPVDTTKPTGKLTLPASPKLAVFVKGVKIALGNCSERASVSGLLQVDAKTAKALKLKGQPGKPVTIGTATAACAPGGKTVLSFKLTSAAAKALKKYRKAVSVAVLVTLTDGAKNAGVLQAKLPVKR